MATSPSFIGTAAIGSVNVATANTAIDGSGTITTLLTGASTGTRVLEVVAQCAASSAAARVNLFLTVDSGTTWRLFDQIAIAAARAVWVMRMRRGWSAPRLLDSAPSLTL